jgi:hypothetical protein
MCTPSMYGGTRMTGLRCWVDLDAFLQRQHLVELEAVGFVHQLVVRGVEMEAELVGDRLDLLVEVGYRLHDFGFARM